MQSQVQRRVLSSSWFILPHRALASTSNSGRDCASLWATVWESQLQADTHCL